MVRFAKGLFLLLAFFSFAGSVLAQDTYDLRKLTQQQWLSMTTEERMNALSSSYRQAPNQTFLGRFNEGADQLYKRWGYDYYEMNDRYENFSFRRPETYDALEVRRSRWSYNQFGDRIPYMRQSYNVWLETYGQDGTYVISNSDSSQGGSGSNFLNATATDGVDGVWVLKEATDDWGASAVFAGALRDNYTPLTLQLPNVPGLRIDLQSANNALSITSAVPLGFSGYGSQFTQTFGAAVLRGGRFRHKFGALTLGATYANQYVTQGSRIGADSWYGTATSFTNTPIYLVVRVLDDSPADGNGGPTVRNVRLKLNGRYRDDIKATAILDDVSRERTTLITSPTMMSYIAPSANVASESPSNDLLSNEYIPKYGDYLYYLQYLQGNNLDNVKAEFNYAKASQYYEVVDSGAPVEVNGTKYVLYLFDIGSITETVYRAEVEMTVDNDYRVQCAYIYSTSQGHDTQGRPTSSYKATYWRTEAQAEGNVKDGSNITTVTVQFSTQVATITYGFDASFNYRGLKISGEYVTNSNHYMYPDAVPGSAASSDLSGLSARTGHRYSERDNAYYIVSQKDWKRFGFSGEYFKVGKFYRPWLDMFYCFNAGAVFGEIDNRNSTVRLPLIEDNDDNDQYPDTMPVARAMGYKVYTNYDPDGVFPGNDADNDGIADNNKNNNGLADYDEPFLMFDADPDAFVFGDDFNNNSIPDFREDDMDIDLPYDRDRAGYHGSLRFTPMTNVNFIAGSMRTHGIGSDYRTNNDYFKVNVNYDVYDIGKLYVEYRRELIQDNFGDDYVQVSTNMLDSYFSQGNGYTSARFGRTLCYDDVEYKNSTVDRVFLESRIRAISSITVENTLKLERNHQLEGMLYNDVYQTEQGINTLAMVNKISYSKDFGNWVFSPGIKFRFYKKDYGEVSRSNEYYLTRIPVATLKYLISSRTDVTFGMQGFPGLQFHFDDRVTDRNDFDQKTYIFQLANRSTYFGYQIWASTGIQYDEMKYCMSDRSYEDYKSSSTFVRVYLGY